MKLIDLHCDTALSIWHKKQSFADCDCHISLEKSAFLEKYIQMTAIFTPPSLSDSEGWDAFLKVYEYLVDDCEKNGIPIIRSRADLEGFAASNKKTAFILTVEDVRILDSKIGRVKEIYDMGIRAVTPLWGGETTIGGSHNTNVGLTDFGKDAISEMIKLGIIPDLSHASFKSADEILDLCDKYKAAPVATHMNSYSVCAHSRNLTNDRLKRLVDLGGIVGVSFCPPHLTSDSCCTSEHIVDHLCYYHEKAKGHVSFGSDYDGTDLPADVSGIESIPKIADKLEARGLTKSEITDISWNSPYDFLEKNL